MTSQKKARKARGFTLIEILVVIGIIAILASIVIIAINPARQFKQAHDTQRVSNINAILNGISQNIADNKGVFTCSGVTLPSSAGTIKKSGTGAVNLRSCLVTTYLPELPFDPVTGSNTCTSVACTGSGEDYDTKYTVMQDSTTGRITVSALGEVTNPISVTR